jgi:hypothetical protein
MKNTTMIDDTNVNPAAEAPVAATEAATEEKPEVAAEAPAAAEEAATEEKVA